MPDAARQTRSLFLSLSFSPSLLGYVGRLARALQLVDFGNSFKVQRTRPRNAATGPDVRTATELESQGLVRGPTAPRHLASPSSKHGVGATLSGAYSRLWKSPTRPRLIVNRVYRSLLVSFLLSFFSFCSTCSFPRLADHLSS